MNLPSAELLLIYALGILFVTLPLILPVYKIKNLSLKNFWIVFWLLSPIILYGLMLFTEHMPGGIGIMLVLLPCMYLLPVWFARRTEKVGGWDGKYLGLFYACVSASFALFPFQALMYAMPLGLIEKDSGLLLLIFYTMPASGIMYSILYFFTKQEF